MNNLTKKAFITGATGCVGKALLKKLLDNNWRCTLLLEPGTKGKYTNPDDSRISKVTGYIQEIPEKVIPAGSVIFHLAARVHTVPHNHREVNEMFLINRDSTLNLAKNALISGASGFVFISSTAVYGKSLEIASCNEASHCMPQTVYAQSKLDAEIGLSEILQNAIPYVILRPSLIYGPGDRGNFLRMLRQVMKGYFVLVNNGKALKNTLYVKNLASILEYMAFHIDSLPHKIYNVADLDCLSFKELALIMAQKTGKKLHILNIPRWGLVPIAFFGDIGSKLLGKELPLTRRRLSVMTSNSVIDISRLHNLVQGNLDLLSFEDGLKDYLKEGP